MPKYVKSGRKKNSFRKRFTKLSLNDTHALLNRLGKEQFEVLKDIAQHFQGNTNKYSTHLPQRAQKKIKPSSYKFITEAKHPYQLGQILQFQNDQHHDHTSESHLGGGLLEAMNSVGNYAWELYNPLPNSVKSTIDKYYGRDISRKMTKEDRYNADLLTVAYKDQEQRVGEIDGYTRLPQYDTEYSTAWRSPKGEISVAIRGSKTFTDWLYHDPLILTRGMPGEDATNNIQQYLIEIAKQNPESDITVNSHSLSGSFVQNAFQQASPEDAEWLDHYTRLNLFNPGASPFVGTDDIKEFTTDPRVYLYLNRTDLISNAYNAVLPEGFSRASYGQPTYDPVTAHSVSQWVSDQTPVAEQTSYLDSEHFDGIHQVIEKAYDSFSIPEL